MLAGNVWMLRGGQKPAVRLTPQVLVRASYVVIASAILLAGSGGCILPGGQRVQPIPGVIGVVVTSPSMPSTGLVRKRVVAKQEPDLLLAEDGTSCRVAEARYREVEIGTDQLCGWQ